MKNFLHFIAVLGVCLAFTGPTPLFGQTLCDETVNIAEAEKKYATGNFDDVFYLLQPCLEKGFSENGKVQAYKILSLTYLAQDSTHRAADAVRKIIAINPRFEPDYSAPPQFKELVTLIKDSQERIIQITSVSKKAENLLQVPATVMVITDKDIHRRGYQNLEQLLHDLPGFDIVKGNGPGYSNFYQRGYRSISNDRTLMLIDGVEENDLASDNVPISRQYPLSDIERVEVVYGPASTMYGANAFVGVINIITKSFAGASGTAKKLAFNGQARYGTWNTKFLDGTLSGRTKDIAVSITTRIFSSDEMNLSRYPEWNFNPRTVQDYPDRWVAATPALQNSDLFTVDTQKNLASWSEKGKQKAADLDNTIFTSVNNNAIRYNDKSTDWFVRAKVEFNDFTLSLINWRTNEGAIPWYTNKSALVSDNYQRWITMNRAYSLTYNKYISDKIQLFNLTSYRIHEIDGATNLTSYTGYFNNALTYTDLLKETLPKFTATYNYRASNQLRNEFRFLWAPKLNMDVTSGIEFRNSIIQGNYITSTSPFPEETGAPAGVLNGGNNFRTFDLGIFSQVTYRYGDHLKLVGGVRVDNNRVRRQGGYGTVVNPRLAAVYTFGDFVFKAIYAEAFKDASYLQKYSTTATRRLNNPNLKPEKVKNLEFSVYYRLSKEMVFSVAGYRANYSNAVGSAPARMPDGTLTTQFQALGKQRIWGIQAEGSYQSERLSIWGNATYTNPINLDSLQRISDIADLMVNMGSNYQITSNWIVNLTGNYVSARKTGKGTFNSQNPNQRFAPYLIFNTAVTYQNIVNGLSVQLTVNNILDTEYFVPGIREANNITTAARFPQERRNISVGVLFNFR